MKKHRANNKRIPPEATAGLLVGIRRVRTEATRPRTPEDHRQAQLIESQRKQEHTDPLNQSLKSHYRVNMDAMHDAVTSQN